MKPEFWWRAASRIEAVMAILGRLAHWCDSKALAALGVRYKGLE